MKIVNSVPLLSAGLLFLNPILLLIFRQMEINLNKLRFWYMVTSGISWIITLVFSFSNPEIRLNLSWISGSDLLSWPVFFLDWVSIPLVLAMTAIPFFAALSQNFSPEHSSWISSLCGICILGVLSDTVYTLLIFWTLVEVFWITFVIIHQEQDRIDKWLILPFVFRLLGPLSLILAGSVGMEGSLAPFISGLSFNAGLYLIVAGIFGFGAWLPMKGISVKNGKLETLEVFLTAIPSAISIMLITRGAALLEVDQFRPLVPILAALFSLGLGLAAIYVQKHQLSWKVWSLGLLGLIVGSALFTSPAGSLTWGLVLLLPSPFLYSSFENRPHLAIALVLAIIGIIPIPFLPVWNGRELFGMDMPGVIFGIAAGLLIGGILNKNKQKLKGELISSDPVPLLFVISPGVLILSQLMIAFQQQLFSSSRLILSQSLAVWIPAILAALSLLIGQSIIRPGFSRINFDRVWNIIYSLVTGITGLVDRIVTLITSLFEGEGGLIWALLIGFLALTLISLRGGG